MPSKTKTRPISNILRTEPSPAEKELQKLLSEFGKTLSVIETHRETNEKRAVKVFELAEQLKLVEKRGGTYVGNGPFRRKKMYATDAEGRRFLLKDFTKLVAENVGEVLATAKKMKYNTSIFSRFSMSNFAKLASDGHRASQNLMYILTEQLSASFTEVKQIIRLPIARTKKHKKE